MKVYCISNQKGGVGKTTTVQAISSGLALKGFRVLAVDLDPQGNLSTACGVDNYNVNTIYEVLKEKIAIQETIIQTKKFDLICSNIMLASAEQELSRTGKEFRLKEALEVVRDEYDYVVIDTPPSLGVLTVNALTAADSVIIPTTAGIFATIGIGQLFDAIRGVKKYCNPKVRIDGILFTRFNARTNIAKEVVTMTETLAEQIDSKVFNTRIRASVSVEEAQALSTDIFTYSEKSTVASDYKEFVDELLNGGMNND